MGLSTVFTVARTVEVMSAEFREQRFELYVSTKCCIL